MGFADSFRRFFTGAPAEARSISAVPWDQGGSLLRRPEITQDRMLALAPMFAATRIIAGTISTLPLKAYRRTVDERTPMSSLPQLFDQLATAGQLVPWVHRCVFSMVVRGNAIGLVTARDGFGFPTNIEWLNPADVYCDDTSPTRPIWYWRSRLVPTEDIVHIPWFPVPGRVLGLSPMAAFATTISTGLAAQIYGNDWFEGGGFPPGTFQNTEADEVTQAQADAIKARLVSAIQSRKPLVFGKQWVYTPITVPPSEAQFVETMRLSATQVANIYGLPPEDLGGMRGNSLTYTTVELNQLERVLAIRPWLVALESMFSSLLPDRQYVRFNADAIVRADLKTRWDVHAIQLAVGAKNLDDVRRDEDEAPLPDGKGQEYNTPALAAARNPAAVAPAAQRAETIWRTPA